MTLMPKPDAASIRAYSDEHECSRQEARETLSQQWRSEQLRDLRKRCSREMDNGNAAAYILDDLIALLQESDQ